MGGRGPVIGILGEYDALGGLSQAVSAAKEPLREGEPGHGCGHLGHHIFPGADYGVYNNSSNGFVNKTVTFTGRSAHAGGRAQCS